MGAQRIEPPPQQPHCIRPVRQGRRPQDSAPRLPGSPAHVHVVQRVRGHLQAAPLTPPLSLCPPRHKPCTRSQEPDIERGVLQTLVEASNGQFR